ncbi:MAG: Gldg family protein [Pseudomonadota bacterium]
MNNKLLTGAGLVFALVLVVAVNMLGSVTFTSARLDLTERKAYTLADGTLQILEKLDEPVTIRLFLSEEIAARTASVTTFANRVRDMLDEFQRHSDGMLRVIIIDPEPFSEEEDRAVGYGLHGIPLDAEGANFYFGLVGTNSTDDEVIVPFLSMEREAFLEYDLAKVLWQLSDIDTKVVGIMSSLPINGIDPQRAMMMGNQAPPAWVVADQIAQLFELRNVGVASTAIPDDIDVLMVVHPKTLTDATLYAIDQYVMRGGRLVLMVDPLSEAEQPDPRNPMAVSRESRFPTLPEAWGFAIDTTKFVGDLQHAMRIRFEHQGQIVAMDFPAWMDLPQGRLADNDTVTSELGKLVFATPGSIRSLGVKGITVTPLVETSDQAMLVDTTALGPGKDPQDVARNYVPGGEVLTVAARVSGRFKSAFPDGPPAQEGQERKAAEEARAAHLSEAKETANMVVVADVDFMEDRFWVQTQNLLGSRLSVPTAGNGSFVINALDSMTGSNDLISVRSRGRYARPFTRVDDIRREAELKFREKEQQLTEELNATEAKLAELSQGTPGGSDALVLSDAGQAEIERFREQKLKIRKELRDVLHKRRKNLEDLEFDLRLFNIGLMPVLIVLAGIAVAAWQVQRRRRSMPA